MGYEYIQLLIENENGGKSTKATLPILRNGLPVIDPYESPYQPYVAYSESNYLTVDNFINAYRHGILPWTLASGVMWSCFQNQGWLNPKKCTYNNSIIRSQGHPYIVKCDTDFESIVNHCSRKGSDNEWITKRLKTLYLDLFKAGYAHSLGVYYDDKLIGGIFFIYLYGVCIAESMFTLISGAGKVALVRLIWQLSRLNCTFIDLRRYKDGSHIDRYGIIKGYREDYLDALHDSLILNPSPWRFDDDLSTSYTPSEAKLMFKISQQ